jgi:hypothetical protein
LPPNIRAEKKNGSLLEFSWDTVKTESSHPKDQAILLAYDIDHQDGLKRYAEKVKCRLEKIDIELFAQLREKIRTDTCKKPSLDKLVCKYPGLMSALCAGRIRAVSAETQNGVLSRNTYRIIFEMTACRSEAGRCVF